MSLNYGIWGWEDPRVDRRRAERRHYREKAQKYFGYALKAREGSYEQHCHLLRAEYYEGCALDS